MANPPPVICARCHGIACDCREQWRPLLDHHRGSSADRAYDGDWQHFRLYILRTRPICESEHGCSQVAEEVHHICKVAARPDLRLDPENVQALCAAHHRALGGRGGRDENSAPATAVSGNSGGN